MLFNSFAFVVLVIITFTLYYLPKLQTFQIPILIVSSLVFYAWHEPELLLLLLFSAFINILTSYSIAHGNGKKKLYAWLGVSTNIFVLAIFKYAGLLSITYLEDTSISSFLITIPLPIGISFFTFQGISLVIDVYKENYTSNKNSVPISFIEHAKNTLLFISFFPQLIAGPIVKAHDFIPQIGNKKFSDINWESSFKNIVLGYFLKMVVADNLKEFTFWITYPYFETLDGLSLLLLLVGFSCQIFADFAGYSLIAIGTSKLFGYYIMDNFNFPYISSSFKEFWKRWHISLSTFLQEYLYIPLGGNRKGKYRTYSNLLITMILGGIWHGAAWSYGIWGLFHGLALATERFITSKVHIKETLVIKYIKVTFVFSMVTFAWLLFKLPDKNHVFKYIEAIYLNPFIQLKGAPLILHILIYSSPILLYHYIYIIKEANYNFNFYKYEPIFYGIIIFLILTNSGTSSAFIYFQF